MSKRILRYESDDGEERFAVWSTITEGWLVYDMNAWQLREWYFGKQMEQARTEINSRIDDLRDGVNRYHAWDTDEMRDALPDDAEVVEVADE